MPRASSRRSVSVSRAWSCSSTSSSDRELAALQPVAGEAEAGDLRDDVLLDAVVQVALEAPALVVLRGDEPLARRGQLLELLGELRGEAHVRDGCRGLAARPCASRARSALAVAPAPSRSELDAAEALGRRGRGRSGRHGIPDERRRRRPAPVPRAPVGAEHADPHPRRVEAVDERRRRAA